MNHIKIKKTLLVVIFHGTWPENNVELFYTNAFLVFTVMHW